MKIKTITEKFSETLEKEKDHFAKIGSLSGFYTKLAKMGIDTKTTYTLPLKDTIGRTFRKQSQAKAHL
jgi:hypothetical protein